MSETFRYWAFISYNHHDRRWARWLHHRLETWRVPGHLIGRAHRDGKIPARLMPMFRDRDELPSSPSLSASIQQALRESRYLIVICSPHAASSRWVNDEIEAFKALGRADRILCWRIERSLRHGDCFPPALLRAVSPASSSPDSQAEPLAADVISDGRDGSVLKLLAGLLGIGYDELRRREHRRRIQRRIMLGVAMVALLSLIVSGWHWQQEEKRRALDAQALQSHIAQLYRNGRQELLAHNEARAAAYLSEAYSLGLDTPALRYLLARAMRVVDAQRLRIDTGSAVWLVDVSQDGSQVLAINDDNHLRAYDANSGARLLDVDVGDMRAFFAAYSPRGTIIWLDSNHDAAPQRRLRLYAARTGALLAQFALNPEASNAAPPPIDDGDRQLSFVDADHSIALIEIGGKRQRLPGTYSAARFCHDSQLLIAGRADGDVELRDAARPGVPVLRRFSGLGQGPTLLDSSAACTLIAAGTAAGDVHVWDAHSGALMMSGGHNRAITDLRFSDGGSRLLTMTRAGLGVWDGSRGALIYADRFFDPYSNLAAMRPDGRALARLSDGRLAVINADSGAELYTLDGHRGGASALAFASDVSHLVSGGSDGTLVVWQQPQRLLAEFSLHTDGDPAGAAASAVAGALVFSHDGRRYFAADDQAAVYASDTRSLQTRLPASAGSVLRATFSSDDHRLATVSADGAVSVWDARSGALLRHWPAFHERALQLGFDSSGRYLAEAIDGRQTRLLDVDTGEQQRLIARDYAHALAFAPRLPLLAVAQNGVVSLTGINDGAPHWAQSLAGSDSPPQRVTVLAFSPDGSKILATAQREHAYLLDARDGRILQQIGEPSSVSFVDATFNADGSAVAIADVGKSVLVWQLAQNRHFTLRGHTASVRAVSFSPDGALLLSAGADGAAKVWDAGNGDLLDSFIAHDGEVQWDFGSFSPDRRYLLTGGSDGYARLWDANEEQRDPGTIRRLLRCRVPWTVDGNRLKSNALDARDCERGLQTR